MKTYEPIQTLKYGPLNAKVNLLPDFFTGFDPVRRAEIVSQEAAFYHGITQPYSVDDRLEKTYTSFRANDGYEVPVKVYRPKNAKGALTALVFMHGGGFITCSAETHDFVPSYLAANANVLAFNIEYRLAPEYKFPVGLEDCYQAIQWIAANAGRLGVDPKRIIVCGDSSGANFAAAITLMARERKDFSIAKQVLIYPALEFTGTIPKRSAEIYTMVGSSGKSHSEISPLMRSYLNDPEREVRSPFVSPILAGNFGGLPEALFIEAECDALADDGLIYAKLLQDAGVKVSCVVYEGMPHAFILRTYEETFAALDKICRFIK
ncbi:MAG TPA: alpha/beta hydrolase [Feifaniaceae bacterium]|nr:alpha/beta hydrolase [Feifaniaceae bacterium]